MNGLKGGKQAGSNATSPISPQHSPISARSSGAGGHSSKRSNDAAFAAQSPDSAEGWEDRDESRIGVKRACNECRQQKLRCDVVQEPFAACSRCRRVNLPCRIDSNFKRVGKRKRNAEMEKEIVELRTQLATQQRQNSQLSPTAMNSSNFNQTMPQMTSTLDQYMGSHEAVASLLDLKSGVDGFMRSPNPNVKPTRHLEDVIISPDQVQELFNIYFRYYHPLIPLLAERSPEHYHDSSLLLFWTIIAIASRHYTPMPNLLRSIHQPLSRLLWATITDVPQGYYVVNALCLLCVWPLPVSSTSTDPTFMISGLMMQIAMQIGLHRPTHAQDFSKFKIELREEELRDRVTTWAACNVVAQRVSTGYGQPPSTFYDWTLAPSGMRETGYRLSDEVDARLRIEMFCDKVTKALYTNTSDPVGLTNEEEKTTLTNILARELDEIEQKLKPNISSINGLYLCAANLHLRLAVFFDSPQKKLYLNDLLALFTATTKFLEQTFALSTSDGNLTKYATNYIVQMIIAAGFSLHKLLNSFFSHFVDVPYGKALFTKTIQTIRSISVMPNDLPSRLAEVLAQLWREGGAGLKTSDGTLDNSLQLKVRCRMSMSLVYDSVWRWREEFLAKGRGNLDAALNNPTQPESSSSSTAASVSALANATILHEGIKLETSGTLDSVLAPPPTTDMSRGVTPGGDFEFAYEVFDPLNWVFDGLVDMPLGFGSTHGMDLDLLGGQGVSI